MGLDSPKDFHAQDGAVEKPKTLRAYVEAVKTQIDKQNKIIREKPDAGNLIPKTLELSDEVRRLDALVDWKGVEILDQPIEMAISVLEEGAGEHDTEYKEKFSGEGPHILKVNVEAGDLVEASNVLGKIVSRMTQFEQGQLY